VWIKDGQGTILCEAKDDSEEDEAGPGPCEVTVADPETKLNASISDTSFRFLGWSGDACTGDNPCVPVLDQNGTETVTFAPPRLS